MKKIARKLLMMMVFLAAMQLAAKAQDIPPDPDAIPLDPGSWILAAAGVGYGVKKWRDSKKSPGKETNETL